MSVGCWAVWVTGGTQVTISEPGAGLTIYVHLVPCRKLIINSFLMPIYYKRLEPFNPLGVSGNSQEIIACCQKCRSANPASAC